MSPLIRSFVRAIILLCISRFLCASVIVKLIDKGITSVPKNITSAVESLFLSKNLITVLDNTSFLRYEQIRYISLTKNPIWRIDNNTFEKNPLLEIFTCSDCKIKVLPSSFGPCTSTLGEMVLTRALTDSSIIRTPYFRSFVSLETLSLSGNGLTDIDNIEIPPSVDVLSGYSNRLSHFPNVSSARFPSLTVLYLDGNYFTNISDSALGGISTTLVTLHLARNQLVEFGNITVLYNIKNLDLRHNDLETIPDILDGLPSLNKLWIEGNRRMTCDHRMCWRRLWDRVRTPIARDDDVECMAPSVVRGHPLSEINPGFMQCDQGGFFC